jgi:hypothetical protein
LTQLILRLISTGTEHKVLRQIGKIDASVVEENRLKRFGELNATVKRNLTKAYESYSKQYNPRTRPQVNYAIGTIVWRKNRQQSNKGEGYMVKLAPRYVKGTINGVKGPYTYVITDDSGKNAGVYHARDLKV